MRCFRREKEAFEDDGGKRDARSRFSVPVLISCLAASPALAIRAQLLLVVSGRQKGHVKFYDALSKGLDYFPEDPDRRLGICTDSSAVLPVILIPFVEALAPALCLKRCGQHC